MADDKQTKIEKLFKKYKDLDGQLSEKELEQLSEKKLDGQLSEKELDILLNRNREKGKKEKVKKPNKNPIGADLMYASKGGMASKKSKVAGKLAKRGYGRAMKGKK